LRARSSAAESSGDLYQGIAGRGFERRFQLAEHVEVRAAKLQKRKSLVASLLTRRS
jgi:molecular chaperone IbpA